MPFDYRSLIPAGIGAGASILGGALQNRSRNRDWELYQQELARRNQLQGMAMPGILRAVGYRDPQQIAQMQLQVSGEQPLGASGANVVPSTPGSTPGSTLGKTLGAGGAGLGIASLAGFGGPIGGLAAGGLILGGKVADQFGKGRRTANQATGGGGFETVFADALAKAARGEISLADLQQAKQNYDNQANAWIAQGGNNEKVARQSMSNPQLQSTYATLMHQLGGRL